MRLYPVAGSSRTLTDDVVYDGFLLPKGSVVEFNFYVLFRQPWIKNCNEFIPERWLDGAEQVYTLI